MKKFIFGLIIICLVCSCTTTKWNSYYHNDPYQFAIDSQQCQQYANGMSNSGATASNYKEAALIGIVEGIVSVGFYQQCMSQRGYYIENN